MVVPGITIPASVSTASLTARRSLGLRGHMRLPGDPGLSGFALLLGAMARGESVVENMHRSEGITAVARALERLGVHATLRNNRWHIQGTGIGGFLPPDGPMELEGAGPFALPLIAVLAAHGFQSRLAGLASDPLADALLGFFRRSGVRIEGEGNDIVLSPPRFSIPLDLELDLGTELGPLTRPFMLHSLAVTGRSILRLPPGFLDPAEGLVTLYGGKLDAAVEPTGVRLSIEGMTTLRAQALAVPGDPTLAVYPAVGAMITHGADVTLKSVVLVPRSVALLEALSLLGGDITLAETRRGSRGVADVTIRGSTLSGAVIPAELGIAPDDFPCLAVAAAFAEGQTVLGGFYDGARRVALVRALRAAGVECVEQVTGLIVRGQRRVQGGGTMPGRLDPGIAMSLLILGMAADQPVTIDDGAIVSALFPNFVTTFEQLGARFIVGGA